MNFAGILTGLVSGFRLCSGCRKGTSGYSGGNT